MEEKNSEADTKDVKVGEKTDSPIQNEEVNEEMPTSLFTLKRPKVRKFSFLMCWSFSS